jgi:hypothetical protein
LPFANGHEKLGNDIFSLTRRQFFEMARNVAWLSVIEGNRNRQLSWSGSWSYKAVNMGEVMVLVSAGTIRLALVGLNKSRLGWIRRTARSEQSAILAIL